MSFTFTFHAGLLHAGEAPADLMCVALTERRENHTIHAQSPDHSHSLPLPLTSKPNPILLRHKPKNSTPTPEPLTVLSTFLHYRRILFISHGLKSINDPIPTLPAFGLSQSTDNPWLAGLQASSWT